MTIRFPRAVAEFAGRVDECRRLDQVCTSHRGEPTLVVVAGPARVGKTALVVHWAHRVAEQYPDGRLFADLSGFGLWTVRELGGILGEFLGTLGVADTELPADARKRSALFTQLTLERRLLVVLDNVRQGGDIRPLLPAGPGCSTVVTSRSPLTHLIAQEAAALLLLAPLA